MQQQPQQPAVDKLVIAVVRNDDANTIVDELVKRRIGNTRINTAGGVPAPGQRDPARRRAGPARSMRPWT